MAYLAQPARLLGAHSDKLQRDAGAHLLEDVGAHPPLSFRDAVDYYDTPLDLTGIACMQLGNAVLDNARSRPAAVPHETVEVGNVDEEHVRVIDYVLRVRRVAAGRVVLNIDTRAHPLVLAQYIVLVFQVILSGLENDAVQVEVLHVLGRYFRDVVRPVKAFRAAAVALRPARFDGHEELVLRMYQIKEIASVDMPCERA